jgi:hypothetical protein
MLRFFIPFFPYLALGTAYALHRSEEHPLQRNVGSLLFWAGILYTWAFSCFATPLFRNATAAFSLSSRREYSLTLPYTSPLVQIGDWIRKNAKKPDRVLLLWEIRLYYFPSNVKREAYEPPPKTPLKPVDRQFLPWLEKRLAQGGYTHVLVNWKHRREWTAHRPMPSEDAFAPLLRKGRLKLLFRYSTGEFTMFRVVPLSPAGH